MKKVFIGFIILLTFFVSYSQAHSLPLNQVALKACQEKERSQACRYSGHHNDLYIGTCQLVTEKKLICVRNKPIQKYEIEQGTPEAHQPFIKMQLLKYQQRDYLPPLQIHGIINSKIEPNTGV